MLFWLDFHQAQSNLYKWFRMQRHDWSSTSSKEPMLHLSLSPCTGYQLQLVSSSKHWCLHVEQSQAQHQPTSTHWWQSTYPLEVWDPLGSNASWYNHREAQILFPEHSRHHSWLLEWPSYPYQEWWIPVNLQATAENSSLSTLLDFILQKKKKKPLSFSLFIPSLASLYLFEQCLRLGIASTSSVYLPL